MTIPALTSGYRPMKIQRHFLVGIAISLSFLSIANVEAKDPETCLINQTGIGPIHLGMTLNEARTALPNADFQRATDGDGAALISVQLGKEDLMTLYANEDDADAPIDWTKKIDFIETFNSLCKTQNGIYPGLLVKEVEKKLGKTKEIIQSEIESREFITFRNQPRHFIFRINYTGIFPEGSRKTKKFKMDSKIFSIAVSPR